MKPFTYALLFILSFTLNLHACKDPIQKAKLWFIQEKEKCEGGFHRFATLATVGADGMPHARMVEITKFNQKKGAVFFTHKNTQKTKDIAHSPKGALNIWLSKTHRQMSINGTIQELSEEETIKVWNQMPRFMKIVFLASDHESLLESDQILNARKEALEKTYQNQGKIPKPAEFVGYNLQPEMITFYEIKSRNFPVKEVAILQENNWNISLVQP